MAYEAKPLDILPGVFKEASEYAAQGRWIDCRNVRFWKGFPERIGGNESLTDQRALAPPRGIMAWRSIDGTQFIAFGHARGVEVLQGGAVFNITPTGTNGYSTLTVQVGSVTSGPYTTGETVTTSAGASGTLVAAAAASPLYVSGDNGTLRLTFASGSGTFVTGETVTSSSGGTAVVLTGGTSPIYCIREDGTFADGDTVTGSASGAARVIDTSGAVSLWTGTITGGSSGATATISNVIETGIIDAGATTSWGEGTFGSSVWGGSESLYSSVIDPTTWTFDKWGEDLLACPRGGMIYLLDSSAFIGDTNTNMAVVSNNAPPNALGIFMSDANRTLVAYGAAEGSVSSPGNDDPLNIRWCDEENYTIWEATAANTAGSIRCENGSTIVGIMTARGGNLISTDTAIYLFRYIGLPFVFSLTQVADGSPMIGPHASAELDGITYWMGRDGFYFYDGAVQPLPCDVHGYVFGRINVVQAHKVFCGTCRAYNEIWWFYCSADSTEIDGYICFNAVERTWHIGDKARTSWIDSGVTIAYPVGTEADGTVNAEEYGITDNGDPIAYMLETNDFEVDDGSIFLHNRMLIPDYDRIVGDHDVTITCMGWPARTSTTKGPYTINDTTQKISVRARGRQLRFLFEGEDDFRMGRWRFRITGHGRKE